MLPAKVWVLWLCDLLLPLCPKRKQRAEQGGVILWRCQNLCSLWRKTNTQNIFILELMSFLFFPSLGFSCHERSCCCRQQPKLITRTRAADPPWIRSPRRERRCFIFLLSLNQSNKISWFDHQQKVFDSDEISQLTPQHCVRHKKSSGFLHIPNY